MSKRRKNNDTGPVIPQQRPEAAQPMGFVPALGWAGWLLKHWKLIGFLSLVLVSGIFHVYQDIKIKSLTNDKKSLVIDVGFWKKEAGECRENFNDLASRVEEAANESKALHTEFDSFKDDLEKMLRGNKAFGPAEDIRNKPTPKECTEAIKFMRDHLDQMKWED